MIDTILTILKMLLVMLPFILFCLLDKKTNLPKPDRSHQFAMPIISVIYSVVAMLLLDRLCRLLLRFINSIPKYIKSLSGWEKMPNAVVAFLERFSEWVEGVLVKLNMGFWVFFIANTVVILVYLIVKRVALFIIAKKVRPDGRIHGRIAGAFYEYCYERGKWCVKDSYVQTRDLLKVFFSTTVVLSMLLLLGSRYFYYYGLMKSVFYPVFGIIIVGEVYFYLDGTTKREYSKDILGEDEDSFKTVNYSLLRKFLRSVFGDKLLAENTSIDNSFSSGTSIGEILFELKKNEDDKVANFALYYESLNKTGFSIDYNYLISSMDMLNGKSVLFNNPFYNDLIPYVFYPMNRALLSHQKVLVVLGRHSVEHDILEWIEKGIEAVTNIPFLWNIGLLTKEEPDNIDIGVLTRSDVLDISLHNANSAFLEDVGFFVILEPSKLISTAQIGLNLIVKKCMSDPEKKIVYCMCDKNCDGLVDAMSHALMTEIIEVSATHKHLGTSSYMCWETDNEYLHHRLIPNISRYLGMGTELSFAALKNQVAKTKWYGGEAFPVTDIRWIDKQYYYDLTKYASLPTNQASMDEHFITTPNFWSATVDRHSYITVEDESFNMFEVLREFSTRTSEQGFVNIISPDYLLKDYMADNASIFEADAKAIPYIVSDYTRSNRNTVLKLVLMMSTYPVSSDVIEKELSLLGINMFDLKKQLWFELYKCYSETNIIKELPNDYNSAVDVVYSRDIERKGTKWNRALIRISKVFDLKSGNVVSMYSISDTEFLNICVSELRSAGYIAEDEKGEHYYLGSELSGQIYQKYLPGQFFTFGGKYYEMQYLTADGQVLVRRASDHINGRPAYRQKREYIIRGIRSSDKIGSCQDIGGMKVVREFADITVKTPGYYRMEKYHDFTTAKQVLFEGENNGIPERTYKNKEILRVEFPLFDGKLSDNVRYTIAILFNEVFKTIFAENQAYVCAVTDDSFLEDCFETKALTYSVRGDGYEIQHDSIYIIEDSQLDLGLTVAVERNLQRIFCIIHDYLDWHMENLEASLVPPEDPKPPVVFTDTEDMDGKKKKKSKSFFSVFFGKIKSFFVRIASLFKRKKKPKDGETSSVHNDGDEDPLNIPNDSASVPEKTKSGSDKNGYSARNATGEENLINTDHVDGKHKKRDLLGWLKRRNRDKKRLNHKDEELDAENGSTNNGGEAKQKGMFSWFKRKKKSNKEYEGDTGDSDFGGGKYEGGITDDVIDGDVSAGKKTEEDNALIADITNEYGSNDSRNADSKSSDGEADCDDVEFGTEEKTQTNDTTESNVDAKSAYTSGINGIESVDEQLSVEKTGQDMLNSPSPNNIMESSNLSSEIDCGSLKEKKPYHERYYLLFGGDSEPSYLDALGALDYLSAIGMKSNSLKQARAGRKIAEYVEATFKPGKPDARYCDFCGSEIYGVEYETLLDGRDRCLNCGRTAIKTGEEFRKIFEDVKRNMESFFGIRINAGVKVEMVNSRTLHKRLGKAFIPTPSADGRVLGVAISDKHGFSLLVENGSPRMASMLTMAHELTHIWQYINWNDKAIRKKYGKKMRLEIYEGMAKWVEIQYAYLINEPALAKREEIITSYRNDEYGRGFLRYRANYPFSGGTVITKPTPFMNIETPLDPEFCGAFMVVRPTDNLSIDSDESQSLKKKNERPFPITERVKGPCERKPYLIVRYAYEQLDTEEKMVYDAVLASLNNYTSKVDMAAYSFDELKVRKILDHIQCDHPEVFWWRGGSSLYVRPDDGIVTNIDLILCMGKDEIDKRQKKIDVAIKPFLSSISTDMSDYEVTLRIYASIISLVDYDTIGLDNQKVEDDPSAPDDLRSIYGAFVNRKAVCAGYAKAFQYLMNICGIECFYVTSSTHAWNVIKLEGDYYHVDVTWGDHSNTQKAKSRPDIISYDCFCITDNEVMMLDGHNPDKGISLPECVAVKCNYYRRQGLYFEIYDLDKIRTVICKCAENGKYDVAFKFATPQVFSKAKCSLIDGGDFRASLQYSNLKVKEKLDLSFSYSVNDECLTISFYIKKA